MNGIKTPLSVLKRTSGINTKVDDLAAYFTLKLCAECRDGVHAWALNCNDVECLHHTDRANALLGGIEK